MISSPQSDYSTNNASSGSSTSVDTADVEALNDLSLPYSILPSYQMHQAIVAKSLDLSPNLDPPAPTYYDSQVPRIFDLHERLHGLNLATADDSHEHNEQHSSYYVYSPTEASSNLQSYFSAIPENSSSIEELLTAAPSIASIGIPSVQSDSVHLGVSFAAMEHSILNAHRNLKQSTGVPADSISMEIHIISDTSGLETPQYTNGDTIEGYVICENVTRKPIPFSVFYILFEGNLFQSKNIFSSSKNKNSAAYNFLQSVDLSGSSTFSSLEPDARYDPIDDTCLVFSDDGLLYPGLKYKRHFAFKVPFKLLDYYCREEGLMRQSELPPTLDSRKIDNLSFYNATIEYSIEAKFIGKDILADSYALLKERSRKVHILPRTLKVLTTLPYREGIKDIDRILRSRVEDLIRFGKEIRNLIAKEEHSKIEYDEEVSLAPPPYYEPKLDSSPIHCLTIPITRKTFSKTPKTSGVLKLSVSTLHHEVKYIPTFETRYTEVSVQDLDSWTIHVPIHMNYVPMSNDKYPEITNITASFECFSYISEKHKLPIEIDFDMLFNNDTGANFQSLVIEKYRNYITELTEQIKYTQDHPEFIVENLLLEDLKAITNCRTKRSAFDIHSCKLAHSTKLNSSSIPWIKNTTNSTHEKDIDVSFNISQVSEMDKKLNFQMNLTSAHLQGSMASYSTVPAYDKYNLVPSYQNCFMGRSYFINLKLELLNGTVTTTKIPITIVN